MYPKEQYFDKVVAIKEIAEGGVKNSCDIEDKNIYENIIQLATELASDFKANKEEKLTSWSHIDVGMDNTVLKHTIKAGIEKIISMMGLPPTDNKVDLDESLTSISLSQLEANDLISIGTGHILEKEMIRMSDLEKDTKID